VSRISYEGMTMLYKMRNGALRSRRGVVALAIFVALAIPVTASASTLAATYVNLANATSFRNGRADFTLKFQLGQSSASTVNAINRAVALTSTCHDCGSAAIAFQVLAITKANLATLNADNSADATSFACIRCSTLAEAYQIIIASDSTPLLTAEQRRGLAQVQAELEALRKYGLDTDQIQTRSDELANQAVSILENGADPAPMLSPAANGPAANGSAPLADISQPIVEVFRSVKTSGA
jgi:hypothetical protein